jgi:hypothetical protein
MICLLFSKPFIFSRCNPKKCNDYGPTVPQYTTVKMKNNVKTAVLVVCILLLLQRTTPASTITTVISDYTNNGLISNALFFAPRGLISDAENNLLYVTGTSYAISNCYVAQSVREFNITSNTIKLIAGMPFMDGTASVCT